MKNVRIIEKTTLREVANYPLSLAKLDEPASPKAYATAAWARAIDSGLVEPLHKDQYEILIDLAEFGTGPQNDLWQWTLLDGARGSAAVADAAVHGLGAVRAASPQYLKILQLVGESIELSLKAFLMSRGYNETQLKRLRHDIPKALRAAVKRGFPEPHPTDVQLLRLLDTTYAARRKLMYHRASAFNLPLLRPLRELAGEYIVHCFLYSAGSPKLIVDQGPEAYGLFINPAAKYEGPTLDEFRIGADGQDLRSLRTIQ